MLIGKLVAKLDELRLRDNTLLLILGDNGTGRGTPSRFKGRDVLGVGPSAAHAAPELRVGEATVAGLAAAGGVAPKAPGQPAHLHGQAAGGRQLEIARD